MTNTEGHLVSHVNQFRLGTCKNVSTSLEFFFNDGSLSGNELAHQFFMQNQLSNVGTCTLMVEMNAGGNNTRLGTLLRHERKLGIKGSLGDEELLVSFKDPTTNHLPRETRTAATLYSTHNQKSLRNAFHNSSHQKGSVRCFESSKGHKLT